MKDLKHVSIVHLNFGNVFLSLTRLNYAAELELKKSRFCL